MYTYKKVWKIMHYIQTHSLSKCNLKILYMKENQQSKGASEIECNE